MTKADHEHGGDGWEFGTCLWCPSTAKPEAGKTAGRDISRRCGVLHSITTAGSKGITPLQLCGYSHAAASFPEPTEPPKAAEWAGRDSYYRIGLAGFTELERALSIPELIAQHADVIKKEKASGVPKYYPFAEYGEGLRLAHGTYLATCTTSLYGLMTEALGQADRPEVKTARGTTTGICRGHAEKA